MLQSPTTPHKFLKKLPKRLAVVDQNPCSGGAGAWLFVACATLPWVVLRFTRFTGEQAFHSHALEVALLGGLAILGASLLLSWAGEVAQLDISQALALAFLAFVAVLPEYSVD